MPNSKISCSEGDIQQCEAELGPRLEDVLRLSIWAATYNFMFCTHEHTSVLGLCQSKALKFNLKSPL